MFKYIEPFGNHVWGDTIGETWISLVNAIIISGDTTYDEKRKRLSLQNVIYQIQSYNLPDYILDSYANSQNIESLVDITFKGDKMYDFDIKPSFSPGAKSYKARIEEGRMLKYVVKRLENIPESKKAVMSFIEWKDYNAILDTPFDDYLPCHTTIQYRLLEQKDCFIMNVISHFRSIDAYQKSCGDFVVTAMLAQKVAKELENKLSKPIHFGPMMGVITDAHIYEECINDATHILKKFKKNESKLELV